MAHKIEKLGLTLFALLCFSSTASAAIQYLPLGEADCLGLGAPPHGGYKPPVADGLGDVFGATEGRTTPHGGQDFSSPIGTPVFPMADGIVVAIKKKDLTKPGCWVAIRHGANVFTTYSHLNCISIAALNVGDPVFGTTAFGKSDNTGAASGGSTGPHLHLEFWNKCPPKVASNNGNCWSGWSGVPPAQSGGGYRDPRCLFSPPPPEPRDPSKWPLSEHISAALFPHDPNAMLGPEGYVKPGQVMTYTIMFENEGVGTAFDVYVTDVFDGNLDDSNIVIKDFYLVDWATNIETPTTLPYSYDPQSHKLTVLAGTFDSRRGGKFTVELRLKPDVPQGTVVKNFATVYFPTALEETRTNSIISAVPQPASVAYTGSTVAVYSSYAMIAASVTSSGQTLLGKTVNFYIGDSSFTTVTGGSGEASVYPQVDIPPGNYQLSAAFPGDGYYYTSSTQTATLQVLKAETYIADFSTVTYSSSPVIAVTMTNSKGVQILHQDTEPKTLHLEYLDGEIWKPLGVASLSSGTAVFQFPLPQQAAVTYKLKARFSGDDKYNAVETTATLTSEYLPPPETPVLVDPKTYPYFGFKTKFGSYGSAPGQLLSPNDVDVDNNGNIYVLDYKSSMLNKFSPEHVFIRRWALPLSQYELSRGLNFCTDTYGGLYVSSDYQVLKFTTDGDLIYSLTGFLGDAWMWFMSDIACGPGGEFYTTNGSGDVLRFDLTGRYLGKFVAKPGSYLGGIATDSHGNIYVSALNDNIIRKFDPDGNLLLHWSSNAGGLLPFSVPGRMKTDSFNNLYINDSGTKRVSVFTSSGEFITAFGGPALPEFSGLKGSSGIGLDPNTGKVYTPNSPGEVAIFALDFSSPTVPAITAPKDGAVIYSVLPGFIGKGKPGQKIEILEYGNVIANAVCDATGWYIVSPQTSFTYGPHRFSARAVDYKGFTSAESSAINVTFRPLSQPRFNPPVSLTAGFTSYGVVSGDFNSDGKNDVAALGDYSYRVFLNNSNGGFTTLPKVAHGYAIAKGIVGDFDKDGVQDIANIQWGTGSWAPLFSVLWGNNDGTFLPSLPITILNGAIRDFSAADLNNDGNMDFAFAGTGVVLLKGAGSRSFQSPSIISSAWSTNIGVEDFNSDGKPDLYANSKLYLGDGVGGFSETGPGFSCQQIIASLDMNGDLNADLITEGPRNVYLGKGNGEFFLSTPFTADVVNGIYEKIDANADGKSDLMTALYTPGAVKVFPNKGDGALASPVDLNSGSQYLVQDLHGKDLNNDGLDDLLSTAYSSTIKVFYNSTASPDMIGPADISGLTAIQQAEGETILSWMAPGGNGTSGQAAAYDLRTATNPLVSESSYIAAVRINSIPAPKISGSTETFAVGGLVGGKTYYFAIKTTDASGNISGLSNSPGVFINYVVKSTAIVGGSPEIFFLSQVPPTLTVISTISGPGAIAIGSATMQSLIIASNMYEIGPEGIYEPPATLTFYYSTAALAGIGLAEADAAVYEYFSGTGWEKLPGQVLDTLNHRITVPITRIASLFAIFGVVKDRTAPQSELQVLGSSWSAAGVGLYVNAQSSISLNAFDLVIYGTSSGVSFTEFRIDAATTAPFALYSGEFTLSTGAHKLEFRSSDNAGNIEAAKTADIVVDGEAPLTRYTVAGSSFAAGGVLYAASGSTITIISSDTSSGVKELLYGVNGSTYSTLTGLAEIYLSSGGAYAVAYQAGDNVGNTVGENVVLVYVDTAAPASALSLTGNVGRNGWYVSTIDAKISALDDSSGIRDMLYSLDDSSFTNYISSFSVLSEGTHTIKAYAVDNVLNSEIIRSSAFGIDTFTPLVGYSYLPAANGEGWNNTPVDVVFTGTDAVSGTEYCSSSFTLAGEGMGIPVSGYCADYAGWTSTVSFSVNIDTTAPASNAEIAAESGLNGWLLSPAGITLASTDSLSGTAGLYYAVDGSSFTLYSSSFAVNAEGAHLLKYYALDKAGNKEAEREFAFKLDLDSPMVSAVPMPVANTYGWNNTAVAVVFSGTDTTSGLAYCEPEKMVETEGSSRTVTGYCSDYAGRSSTVSLTVSVDTTAPNLSYTPEPLANQLGWNNSDVLLKFTCADGLSGVKSCPADILLAGEGVNISTSGAVYDYAGNSGDILVSGIKIDRTAPISTAAVSGVYKNGWYSSPVIVVLASTDSLSGLKGIVYSLDGGGYSEYTQPVVVSSEGNHVLSYYSEDLAGNTESARIIDFAIDATAPMVDYLLNPPANPIGWNSSPVSVLFRGSDTLSGIVDCSSVTIAIEGKGQEIIGWCRDLAGNIAYATATLNIDLTRPLVSADQAPASNASGWNNSDVLLKFTCADSLSGVKACPADILLAGEGVNISTFAVAFDLAGNIRYTTAILKIDRTPPVITISSPAPGHVFIATRGDIGVKFGVTDNLDPAPASGAWLEQVEDRGSPRGARPARLAVVNGQSIEPLDIDDGSWRLIVSATDFADNAAQLTGGAFEIIHDVLAPRTSQAITAGPSLTVGATTYITSAARLELTSIDDLVSANDGIGLGVKDQSIRVKSGGSLVKELLFANPAPKQGEAFISSFTGAGLGVADGVYGLAYNASDVLGNIETEKSVLIGLDDTAPVSSSELAGTAGGNGWHISTVTVSLTATDPLSGVAGISYGLDSGAYVAYTSPMETAAEGQRTVRFYARDRLGNTEAGKSMDFKIDRTPPVVISTITPAANADGWHNGTVNVGFSGNDAVSGIAYCEPAGTMRAEGRGLELSGYCRDQAGLTSKATARFNVDLTSPTVIIERAPLANIRGWNNTDVKVTFTCADALSSIKSCPSAVTLAGEGAGQGAGGTAADYADNISSASMGGINIDKTTPAGSLSVTGELWESGSDKYLNPRSAIALAATDGLSGVEAMEYYVDEAPFGVYSSSFSLAEGLRTVHYRAIDKADNIEATRTALYRVDGAGPATFLKAVGGSRYSGPEPGSFYASLASRFTLEAADPVTSGVASGVRLTSWSDNGGAASNAAENLAFAEGRHVLAYWSMDNVDNQEVAKSTTILVDNTAPVTTHHIGSPYHAAGGVNYITPTTPLTFTAGDPVSGEVASGVSRIEVSLDGSLFGAYSSELKFAEGHHTIKYRAVDNVGNTEAEKTLELRSDNTPPVSKWRVNSGDSVELGGRFYLNTQGKINLESADPVVAEVTSGLEGIYYGINTAPAGKYSAPLGLAEGIRTVNFSARDNVGNTEVAKSTVIYVDGTGPVSGLTLTGDQYHGDKVHISTRTGIMITSVDPIVNEVASGLKETKYSVDGGLFANYSLFRLSAEGKRLVSYYSADYVANTETVKTAALWVDNTPPSTELTVAGARYTAPGDEKLYVTRDSGIVLTSSDPVSNDTASGVMLTKYRIDNGNWLVYSGSFTIAAEGLHTLEYYALDRVQNAETLRFAKLAVDNTPPVTGISLGEPKSEVFGLPVLMQNTPVTLTAADPVVNSISAGLNSIFYELENAQTGVRSLVKAYTSPFTITEQGTFIIRYWSKDNTGNTETPKEKMAAVTTWRADGLIAASGLDMSGTADISGSVKSNAIVSLGGNARILGDVTASTITLTGKAQITGLQINGATPVNPAPIYLAGIVQNAVAVNNNALVSAYLVDGKLTISSKVNLTLSTGTYYFKGMDLSGGSSITISGKVDILVEGGITINGGSSMNASGEASGLSIIVSTASELKFNGGGSLAACVYAPYSDLKLTGNALLGGHYFVRTAAVSGTGNLLQSGEALPVAAAPTGGGPKTKAAAMSSSRVGVLAGPDPEFRLGEVYVFPNPAKGTEAPVFHIETGIADSVKITIYTISGRAAHEHTLTGLPVELDDGNGLSYAYEYTWHGHIPSGVYLYSIETRKAGQTLKKTGKFSVVR